MRWNLTLCMIQSIIKQKCPLATYLTEYDLVKLSSQQLDSISRDLLG